MCHSPQGHQQIVDLAPMLRHRAGTETYRRGRHPRISAAQFAASVHTLNAATAAGGGHSSMNLNSAAAKSLLNLGDPRDFARPLYKKDIFFSGNLRKHVAEYKQSKGDIGEYMKSQISIPADQEVCIAILRNTYATPD